MLERHEREDLTAFYRLTGEEEFLLDHFEGFPVMPGVLLLESLRQAASVLLSNPEDPRKTAWRLESAEDVKFGQFVRPGSGLRISVRASGQDGPARLVEGRIDLTDDGGVARGKALTASLRLVPLEIPVR